MKKFLENIFVGVNRLAVSMKTYKADSVDAVDQMHDIFHNLDLVMESVSSISRVAECRTKDVNVSIETSYMKSREINSDFSKGHFIRTYQLQQDISSSTPIKSSQPLPTESDIKRSLSGESDGSSSPTSSTGQQPQPRLMKKSTIIVESAYQSPARTPLRQHKCITCKCIMNCKPVEKVPTVPTASNAVPLTSNLASVQDKKYIRTTDTHTQVDLSEMIVPLFATSKIFSLVHMLPKSHSRKVIDAVAVDIESNSILIKQVLIKQRKNS